MSKRIVIFNHKGGVSKTTSVYNLGWMMSKRHRVLLVDGDPQCNLSSLVLRDKFEEYYLNSETKKQNIKDGVEPAFKGKPVPIEPVRCTSPERNENLFLLAGHANLSEHEAALTFAQTSNNAISTLENLPGAFLRLIELTEQKYDIEYTVIDLNPGLSAINQNLFLLCDGFLVPTNPDPFSIMALKTLETMLPRWAEWKANAVEIFSDSAYPMSDKIPKFCGSIVQRFNIRNGVAAKPFRNNIDEINELIEGSFIEAMKRADMALTDDCYTHEIRSNHYCLAEIPDFQGLLPKANMAGVPVFELLDDEIKEVGNILHTLQVKRDKFNRDFIDLSEKVIGLLENA